MDAEFQKTVDLCRARNAERAEESKRQKAKAVRRNKKNTSTTKPSNAADLLYTNHKARAKRMGREFSISIDDIHSLLQRSEGRCEVTGVKFVYSSDNNVRRRPFAPSIDRIDCSKGYVPGNCRVVCVAANIAMSDWGEEVLHAMFWSMLDQGKFKRVQSGAFDPENEQCGSL